MGLALVLGALSLGVLLGQSPLKLMGLGGLSGLALSGGSEGLCFGSGFSFDSFGLLSAGLVFWCYALGLLSVPSRANTSKGLMALASGLALALTLAFASRDLVLLYFWFESALIPMALLVLVYGPQPERLSGALYLWAYTLAASLPLLGCLVVSQASAGCSPLAGLSSVKPWGPIEGLLVLAFLAKGPSYGLHLWLPQTHVEASTLGSIFLAGVLLKLAFLGLIRSGALEYIGPGYLWGLIVMGGGALGGAAALSQVDLKSVVAYSSVCHMALGLAALLSGLSGALGAGLLLALGHGVVSASLFLLVGCLGEMKGSRSVLTQSGQQAEGQLLSGLVALCFLNVAAPPFLSLLAELGLISGVMSVSALAVLSCWGAMVSSLALSVYIWCVVAHGPSGSGLSRALGCSSAPIAMAGCSSWALLGVLSFELL